MQLNPTLLNFYSMVNSSKDKSNLLSLLSLKLLIIKLTKRLLSKIIQQIKRNQISKMLIRPLNQTYQNLSSLLKVSNFNKLFNYSEIFNGIKIVF